ncbi:hypothetical protein REPUB_Repub13aG0116900 [Reevesia pubescens]
MFKSKLAKQKHPETMEETFSLILHGCKLAKDLESNLANLANQPEILSKSCDDIIKIFGTAKEGLNNAHHQDPALFTHLLGREIQSNTSSSSSQQQQQLQSDPSLQEWLKYGGVITQAMDMIQQQLLAGKTSTTPFEINKMGGKNLLEASAASLLLKGSIGGEIQAMDVSESGRGSSSSSSQRPRRRKDDEEKCTRRVAAPQIGNTDLPPDDNYTWRKYGQKEILGSTYPRAYYRCTHQKMYNCPAKKQVQRLDNDFYTFEVTYIGQHTCHMSSTAPSIPLPPPPTTSIEITTQDQTQMLMTQAMVTQPTPTNSSTSVPLGRWLSMEFSLGSGSGGSGSGRGAAGGSTTGSRYGRDVVDYPAVADMADVMFNSGSSSSNSMDFIFSGVEDKNEGGGVGDKKN